MIYFFSFFLCLPPSPRAKNSFAIVYWDLKLSLLSLFNLVYYFLILLLKLVTFNEKRKKQIFRLRGKIVAGKTTDVFTI